MPNGLFKLDWASIIDAVILAATVAVIGGLVQLVSGTGFDVFSANWILVGKTMVNLAFSAGILSLGKDFLSTNTGSLLGVGPANPPSTQG